jgi:two-component system, chemotaxis family, response regulator Rcp1
MGFPQQLTIMIVEDNRADVFLLKKALHKADICFTAIVFEDGESAFRYIDGEPCLETRSTPDLAILDLNLPKRDGSEVLAHIRRNRKLQHIPVVVLSSSPRQLMRDRAAQADCYITKPSQLDEFLQIGEQIRDCVEAVRATAAVRKLPEAWKI